MKRAAKRAPAPGDVLVRLQPHLADSIDAWRRNQPAIPSRAEAIRRLVEQALRSHDAANRTKQR